jgi:hypothetical protein
MANTGGVHWIRSLLTSGDAPSHFVQIVKQGTEFKLVHTCRVADAHESSHQTEQTAPHVGAAAGKEYVNSGGTTPDDLGDLHITGYLFHHRLVLDEQDVNSR